MSQFKEALLGMMMKYEGKDRIPTILTYKSYSYLLEMVKAEIKALSDTVDADKVLTEPKYQSIEGMDSLIRQVAFDSLARYREYEEILEKEAVFLNKGADDERILIPLCLGYERELFMPLLLRASGDEKDVFKIFSGFDVD